MISIVIADDHAVVRTGLQLIFSDNNISVDAEANSGEALLQLLKTYIFDVAVVDVNMPGMPCSELLSVLQKKYPQLPVVIFTMNNDEALASSLFKQGVKAYINKEDDPKELIKAVKKAAENERYLTRQQELYLVNQSILGNTSANQLDKLTKREVEIMQLLASGHSLSEISVKLKISKNTISNHRNSILKKLNLANNAELTKYAISHNMIK